MSHQTFQVGDQCYIRPSTRYPKFSFLPGVITGGLEMRDVYDDEGELMGQREAYKVKVQGEEVCAPPSMLIKQE
jgi:hypothetical protein